jgi:hypothetical protein
VDRNDGVDWTVSNSFNSCLGLLSQLSHRC